MISRSHAKLVCDSVGKCTIIDMNSTNGVYVNDCKVDAAVLHNGDRITFGGRGKLVSVGQVDPQPDSEFIYEYQSDEEAGKEESAFELLKSLTDNIQVVITWITTAIFLASYLFADESSTEFSYVRLYVSPVFALVGLPFTRFTFTVSFVLVAIMLLAVVLLIITQRQNSIRSAKEEKKKKRASSSAGLSGSNKKK